MSSWRVDSGSYSAPEYLGIDHVLGRNSENDVLRVNALERPAMLASRRTPAEQMKAHRKDDDLGYSRRATRNAPILHAENTVPYTVIVESPVDQMAPTTFEEDIGPRIVDALEPFEEDMEIDEVASAVRTGDEITPDGYPSGRTLSGNALYDMGDTVICQGAINIGPWDRIDGWRLENMDPEIEEAVENLPYFEASRSEVADNLVESFTGGEYDDLKLNGYSEDVQVLVDERFDNGYWPEGPEDPEQTGHCMVEKEDGMVF